MTVLITGAAGYIGSHAVLAFREAGYQVVAVDLLTTGRRDAIPADVPFFEANAGDIERMKGIVRAHDVKCVVHFAASIVIPESVDEPLEYYLNNTAVSRNLIQTCVDNDVGHFIYSSTSAVYGTPETLPVSEAAPTAPINPYGRSKLMTEWILQDCVAATDLTCVVLRYFNVAGADPRGRTGQSTSKATHLIKVACEAAVGIRDGIEIFGEDYDTPDGTCIRDYIHVSDLVDAHVQGLRHLEAGGDSQVLNCGYGHGYSVKEVLATLQKVSGRTLNVRLGGRRPGDAPALVADASRIREILGWHPSRDDLSVIVESAFRWERFLVERRRAEI